MSAPRSCHPLLGFEGRMGRVAFLGWGLPVLVAGRVALAPVLLAVSEEAPAVSPALPLALAVLGGAVLLAALWALLALIVKRLHDRDLSGGHAAWIMAVLLFAGLIGMPLDPLLDELVAIFALGLLAWLAIVRGTEGPNRFGPPPASRREG
nr:DUF805 domain-containing protein [uncultured Roseococcus sp.]